MAKAKPLLRVNRLRFDRGPFTLDIPRLTISTGRVACLVGANGSGKTTLLELAVGLIQPLRRAVTIHGKPAALDNPETKRLLGYIPDDDNWVIAELTAREYFELLKSVYRQRPLEEIVFENTVRDTARQLLFTDFDKQLGRLSHGNKRKVQIIAALMHRPPLLVVDELRNGLDPVAIHRAEQLLRRYCRTGGTILAATHDLWWAERFADDIVMLQDGHIALQETKSKIVRQAGSLEQKFLELYEASYVATAT